MKIKIVIEVPDKHAENLLLEVEQVVMTPNYDAKIVEQEEVKP